MSQSLRQNNLFLAEDWQAIYRSFQDIDFRAYDFDTIRDSLIDYVRTYYPENFNDYIDSSEFIAIVELLAWLGSSLAFRVDLNSRENFLDTAERRESIVRLARMLNYQPRRNVPATGLVKLTAVETNEPVQDSRGRNLSRSTVFWNDPNNPDSFEQFVAVLNAAFSGTNPFGRPLKSGTVGAVSTDLYRFEPVPDNAVTYSVPVRVRSNNIPVDIVNVDFRDGERFFERAPDFDTPFHLIYRNDGEGQGSADTGFFLHFRQGTLQSTDVAFDTPLANRVFNIDTDNINETDVYFQQIDSAGTVIDQWQRVPSVTGNNVIFNNLSADQRNIFSVISRNNDQIALRFADGNFGAVPTGVFRSWYRVSANQSVILRPENLQNAEITVPYTGKDGQQYALRLVFSLVRTVSNSAPTETNEQIKQRAPQVYYTQDRMITGEDYSVFPLTRGSEIVKIKAANRTHSGHSRFIDINDPTGAFQNTLVLGNDGALWTDLEPARTKASTALTRTQIAQSVIGEFVRNQFLQNFFYSEFVGVYENQIATGDFDLLNNSGFDELRWITTPQRSQAAVGVISSGVRTTGAAQYLNTLSTSVAPAVKLIKPGCKIKFVDPNEIAESDPVNFSWVTVRGIRTVDDGVNVYSELELSAAVTDGWFATELLPAFRRSLDAVELANISAQNQALGLNTAFGIGYDPAGNNYRGRWYIIPGITDSDVSLPFDLTLSGSTVDRTNLSSWLVHAQFNAPDDQWIFTSRGRRYVFESFDQARFFFDDNARTLDVQKGRALRDIIELLPQNTRTEPAPAQSTISFPRPVNMNIQSVLMYEDGYRDPRKVVVKPVDEDRDGVPDDPTILEQVVQNFGNPQNVYFERITDFDGYEYFVPWRSAQLTVNAVTATTFTELTSGVSVPDTVWAIRGTVPDGSLNPPTVTRDISDIDLVVLTGTGTSTVTNLVNTINSTQPAVPPADYAQVRTQRVSGTVVFDSDTGEFWQLQPDSTDLTQTQAVLSNSYAHRVGRSTTLNTLRSQPNPLRFQWQHFAPLENRIDPSISNIIDMFIVTAGYFEQVQSWKKRNSSIEAFPESPTSESLRIQFDELEQFKAISDQLVYKPGQFKLLFGTGAEPELQARFKVVKLPTTTLTDNEIKSRVIDAVDQYFDIANWDFGERFFYTELGAFVHQQLANVISTVVIVPQKADSAFGNLFQIKSEPNELFLSTATVSDVDVVRNLTETNLRISR